MWKGKRAMKCDYCKREIKKAEGYNECKTGNYHTGCVSRMVDSLVADKENLYKNLRTARDEQDRLCYKWARLKEENEYIKHEIEEAYKIAHEYLTVYPQGYTNVRYSLKELFQQAKAMHEQNRANEYYLESKISEIEAEVNGDY